jgi:hypothetical protein
MRSSSAFFSTRARKLQNTWPWGKVIKFAGIKADRSLPDFRVSRVRSGSMNEPASRQGAARGAGANGTDGVIKRAGYGDGPGALS